MKRSTHHFLIHPSSFYLHPFQASLAGFEPAVSTVTRWRGLRTPLQGRILASRVASAPGALRALTRPGSPASSSRRPGNRTPLLVLPRHADYRLPRRRSVRGEGIEPSSPGSGPGGLPVADPRVIDTALSPKFGEKGSNLHRLIQSQAAYH